MWGILMIMLAIYSLWDIRAKSLPMLWVAAGLILAVLSGVGGRMQAGDASLWESVLFSIQGMLPGGVFILLAIVMKGKLGAGDGMILAIIGGMTGISYAVAVMTIALMLAFVYSCILLAVCKKGKNHCFPFVPFCFGGTVLVYITMVM